MDTKERILGCMNRAFKINNASEETSQDNCETWDSMNHLNLVVELEEEFDIELEPEDIAMMKSFKNVLEIVESQL